MNKFLILLVAAGWLGGLAARAAGQGGEVVVVYNTRMTESRDVAEHYAAMRHVPKTQVIGLDLPENEAITRVDFRERLQKPLAAKLEEKGLWRFEEAGIPATDNGPRHLQRKVTQARFRYFALCYGVPLLILKDSNLHEEGADKLPESLRRNEAAVDSELACLPILDEMMLAGPRTNAYYGATNAQVFNPTNGIVMVTRLDGPTASIARGLVDKAMEAETNGLWGRGYFDMRGLTNGPFQLGDEWIAGAADACFRAGFETVTDTNGGTFPAGFPLSQVAFYAGWYDENVSGPFARPTVEFMPGAFAYHLHSFSAATIRSTKRQWVGPLLDRGVTATMGCVDEPYLSGSPDIAMFFARFIHSAFSFGEAAYAAQNYLSWQTTVVGDPLYCPFCGSPVELQAELERRHSKLVEWSYLRSINSFLLRGAPPGQIAEQLENFAAAKKSAVLQEKLADLCNAQGKPSSCVQALQNVLKLDPSPQQRVRVMLELAERLQPLGRDNEAYDTYQQFVKQFPEYPDMPAIYRALANLARKLGRNGDEENYEQLLNKQNPAPKPLPEKTPPVHKFP